MLTELSIEQFLAELGSKKPTPGGGSASALAAALAGSLVQMVANLSGEEEASAAAEAQALTDSLLQLTNEDAEAFNRVMKAYGLPRKTDQEKKSRSGEIQRAIRSATEVPLQIMEVALKTLHLAEELGLRGNPNTISDAGVAGLLGWAACRGAAYNVAINLPGLKDAEFKEQAQERLRDLLKEGQRLEKEISEHLARVLGAGGLLFS